jgi:hypothetical protein
MPQLRALPDAIERVLAEHATRTRQCDQSSVIIRDFCGVQSRDATFGALKGANLLVVVYTTA